MADEPIANETKIIVDKANEISLTLSSFPEHIVFSIICCLHSMALKKGAQPAMMEECIDAFMTNCDFTQDASRKPQ